MYSNYQETMFLNRCDCECPHINANGVLPVCHKYKKKLGLGEQPFTSAERCTECLLDEALSVNVRVNKLLANILET